MALVEDGVLGLNRPVREYLPELVGKGTEAVMVHHLMTHTSGFRDEDVAEHIARKRRVGEIPTPDQTSSPLEEFYRDWPFLQQFAAANDAPLWKSPGAEMSYCQYGFSLLDEIVLRVAGRPLSEVAVERIFEPLAMASRLRLGCAWFERVRADNMVVRQRVLDRGRYGCVRPDVPGPRPLR